MIGQTLGIIQSVFGPPKKERKTPTGRFLQRVTTGSNFVPGSGQTPAPAVQQNPLFSGSVQFGGEQRNRNLLNLAGLAVLAFLGWAFFRKNGRRKRR